ncbi:DUF4292 domain-containing protein [Flavitalea sp. BT771]|uniref:DUF4292 domain-containing protein n=1 Tax=Flavitalea sp. BT771 TaxID=3063329 RepID=UPI0026E25C02|nr:DUF4292 domain-containing protein [Flavitalea sp. BT771]MDO6432943.1 DUF4292 domain-containing protein [Flavitalea sp. BT771]MDV6221781.1 DUF4292 domain-containing protein [Flavitalea sp. BT771]
MMHKLLAVIALVVAMAGVMAGCRSTKKIQKVIATPGTRKDSAAVTVTPVVTPEDRHADSLRIISQTVQGLMRTHIDFQTFSARMKVHYEGGDGKDYEFNAFIHIKKDSLIWVSINAALGIEAFRMLITPDSVKILDKLKKIARLRSVSFLQDEIHLPVDFKTVQDLLLGNPIYLDTTNILFYKKDPSAISLLSVGDLFKNYLTLNGDNTLRHCKLDDVDPFRARTCDLTYGDYEQRDTLRFSTYRKISVAEKTKVDIELGYKQFKFNEPLSFSFNIPRNYRRR